MAEKDAAEDDKKKGGDGADDKVKETILESNESGQDLQAEEAIRYFIRDRLIDFYNEMEQSIDSLEAYLMSQPEEFKTAFSQQGFFSFLGETFQKELANTVGGMGHPIMDAMVGEIYNAAAFAEHSSGNDLSVFINNALRRSVRDACWFVRDSAPGILSAQWGDLLKLAADGANQFIPALYQLGLPSYAFKPTEFTDVMREQADGYRRAMGLQTKEVEEKQPEVQQNEKKDEIDEQAQKDMAMQEEKQKGQLSATL